MTTQSYKVYVNTLRNAWFMVNNGCTHYSLFDKSKSNTGHDDFDSTEIGRLEFDSDWTLDVNKLGDPVLVKDDWKVVIVLDGEYADDIRRIPDKGVTFIRGISADAIDLATSPRWQELNTFEDEE